MKIPNIIDNFNFRLTNNKMQRIKRSIDEFNLTMQNLGINDDIYIKSQDTNNYKKTTKDINIGRNSITR